MQQGTQTVTELASRHTWRGWKTMRDAGAGGTPPMSDTGGVLRVWRGLGRRSRKLQAWFRRPRIVHPPQKMQQSNSTRNFSHPMLAAAAKESTLEDEFDELCFRQKRLEREGKSFA